MVIGFDDISVLEKLPNLTTLGLENNNISDIGVLEKFPNLTHLYLSDNNISDKCPRKLSI